MTEGGPASSLLLEIEPGGESWTVRAPSLGREPHVVASPLQDERFLGELRELREWASRPILRSDPLALGNRDYLQRLSRKLGERITAILLSGSAREALAGEIRRAGSRPVRLTVRVRGVGPLADTALALPWELLAPEPGNFVVRARSLQVIREVVADGAPELPAPDGPLSVAVMIAAPEDRTAIPYEEESFRLQLALSPLGHQVAFSDLGGLGDLVQLVDDRNATVIHFSGHGLPGKLLFEDRLGFAEDVAVEELERRLNRVLLNPSRAGTFPRLFFLSSCYGAAKGRDPDDSPSTAAALHRRGFAQVLGYFGPVDAELSTRAEEAFYRALARGETALAASEALRSTLDQPLGEEAERVYPLGWSQLAIYHRGPDLPLAAIGQPTLAETAEPSRRKMVQVSGLPVLERGFIGRRGLQHEVLRKARDGQRLIVFQGLGGLGKTALASQLVSRVFAPDEPADQLILRCRELEAGDPILELRAQAEEHGRVHGFDDWEERVMDFRERVPEATPGFEAVIREIWAFRPDLVVYADNAESLQTGPETDDPGVLGSWRPGVEAWWEAMEHLAEDGLLVLASTRYAWEGLGPRAHLGIVPMSPADSLRLIASFDQLQSLPLAARRRLAERVDGHPRTVEFLARLVGLQWGRLGEGYQLADAWRELIEPVLPDQEAWITTDLLLAELRKRLSDEAQEHAARLMVLRTAAPTPVLDSLGGRRDELIRAGWLTRYREQSVSDAGVEWVEIWGLHALVRERLEFRTTEVEWEHAHRRAGEGYETWLQGSDWRRADEREAIYHFFAIREGDRAWPIVQRYALWLRDRGRFAEAVQLIESCEAAGVQGDHLALAQMLTVQLRKIMGDRSDQLLALLDRALETGTSLQSRSVLLHEYGSLLSNQGRYAEAEQRLRQALEIDEQTLGASDGSVGYTLHTLSNLLFRQGKYGEAEQALRRALAIKRESLGEGHPDYAVSLHSLGLVLLKEGQTKEAEETLRAAVEVKRASLGVEHASYATSLHSLAEVVAQAGRYTEAEGLFRQAIVIKEATLGKAHPSYGVSLQALAGVVLKQGHTREALELMRQALPIQFETLGEDHPSYAASLQTLGLVLSVEGEYEEAEERLQQALEIQKRRVGTRHSAYAATLYTWAGVLIKKGENRRAEELLREVVATFEVAVGRDHSYRLSALASLADALAGQERYMEAESYYLEALDTSLRIHPPNHPQTGEMFYGLARVQSSVGNPSAFQSAQKAMAVFSQSLGPEHPVMQEAAPALQKIIREMAPARLAQLVDQARQAFEQGDLEAAIANQEEAVLLARMDNGDRTASLTLGALLYNLANDYVRAGRYEDAVRALEEVVALDELTGDEDLERDRRELDALRTMAALPPEERSRLESRLSLKRES